MTEVSFMNRLNNGEILVSDGAVGTMLIQKGLKPGECPDILNLSNPELLEEIARLYLDAGADIIHSSTFGASPMKLKEYGLDDKTEEINRTAVSIMKKAAGSDAYVSASVGPTGKILKPYGDIEPDALYACFERQVKALAGAETDIFTIETMIDLNEAVIAVKAAKSVSPQTPVIATMTFEKIPRGFFTVMGASVEAAAAGLKEAGADVIGSNCGNGFEDMVAIAREFKRLTALPVIIQSNAGMPQLRKNKVIYPETPEFFAEKARDLIEAGVLIIGGCCGSTPEHIRAIRKAVDELK